MEKSKNKLPKATKTEELNKRAERKFEDLFCISSGFQPTKIPLENDKGIDYIVNLLDENSCVLPDKFIAQLKSTHKATCKDSRILAKGFPVKTINLLRGDALPAYVFCYDLTTDKMYWGELGNLLDILHQKGIRWNEQEKTTLYFNEQKSVDKRTIEKIYNDTKYSCSHLSEIISNQELLDSLLPYCNIKVEYTNKVKNVHISPFKRGFEGKLSFKVGNVGAFEKFKDFQSKGLPSLLPVDSGKLVFTYEGKEVYTLNNIEKIQTSSIKNGLPVELLVPGANVSAGYFRFTAKSTSKELKLSSDKYCLPWSIQITINPQEKKADFTIKFYKEFGNIAEYLKYLKFTKALSEHKKYELKNAMGSHQMEIVDGSYPEVQGWEVDFLENLLSIEKCANKKFDIPKAVTEENIKDAYLFSKLFAHGEAKLPNMKLSFKMLGKHLKERIAGLPLKGKELILETDMSAELCGQAFEINVRIIIEKALPDNSTEELFSYPKRIQDESEYSISYMAKDGSDAKIVLIKKEEPITMSSPGEVKELPKNE